LTVRISNKS